LAILAWGNSTGASQAIQQASISFGLRRSHKTETVKTPAVKPYAKHVASTWPHPSRWIKRVWVYLRFVPYCFVVGSPGKLQVISRSLTT
jgi:hypothetical protein